MKKALFAEYVGWRSPIQVGGHHYAKGFLKRGYKIGWLLANWFPLKFFTHTELTRYAFNVWKTRGRLVEENVWEYSPLTLIPYTDFYFLKSHFIAEKSLSFTVPSLLRILEKAGFNKVDILWLDHLKYASLINKIKFDISIYRMCDYVPAFPNTPKSLVILEEEIMRQVDIIVISSRHLFEITKKIRKDNVYYLPNGVDFEHFYLGSDSLPEDFRNIPSPRVVYIGAIDTWLDIYLLKYCAENLLNYSFILIGPSRIDLSLLKNCKNIFVLGSKDYNVIPKYLKNSDVGIIPFKKTDLIKYVNPIKLYEYMACGLPVVSMEWKELKYINPPAFLARNRKEFVEMIQAALVSKRNEKDKTKRINFARENSWEKRFKIVYGLVKGK